MKGRHRLGLVLGVLSLLAAALAPVAIAGQDNLANAGFETGNFTGWQMAAPVSDPENKGYLAVVKDDEFYETAYAYQFPSLAGDKVQIKPSEGAFMARLGKPGYTQVEGQNEIWQEFTATSPFLVFTYNLCSYDAAPFDWFEFSVTAVDDPGTPIARRTLTAPGGKFGGQAWCSGWQDTTVDISGWKGKRLKMYVSAGGTSGDWGPTWAYVDGPKAVAHITANVDIAPDSLNLRDKQNGNSVVTAYLELPSGMNAADVAVNTVRLVVNGQEVPAMLKPASIGDYDGDQVQDLMVKFNRQAVVSAIGSAKGDVQVEVRGDLKNASPSFVASDVVRVLEK